MDWAASRGLAAKVGFLAPERSKIQDGKKLETMLRTGGIWRDVPAANVLNLFADIVAKLPGATPPVRQMLQQRLRAPNGISWALVGGGLALPHLRTPIALGRDAGIFAIVLLRDALAVERTRAGRTAGHAAAVFRRAVAARASGNSRPIEHARSRAAICASGSHGNAADDEIFRRRRRRRNRRPTKEGGA